MSKRKQKICELITCLQQSNKRWIKIKNISDRELLYSLNLIKYRQNFNTIVEVNNESFYLTSNDEVNKKMFSKFKIISNLNTNYLLIKQIICNNLSDMSKEEISKELEECFENDLDGICQFCNMFECECI